MPYTFLLGCFWSVERAIVSRGQVRLWLFLLAGLQVLEACMFICIFIYILSQTEHFLSVGLMMFRRYF